MKFWYIRIRVFLGLSQFICWHIQTHQNYLSLDEISKKLKHLVVVFIGGGLGSSLRYLIGKLLNTTNSNFPSGTFVVNVVGSLLMGLILGYLAKQHQVSDHYTLALATGFCGGFTTFSAFAIENQQFLKSGDLTSFFIYTLSSIVLGIGAVFLGLYLTKTLNV